MSQNTSDSALRGVFGSTMSLSELSGDSPSHLSPRSGYSRFGLNEHPPAHKMHTKVRRHSSVSGKRPKRPKRRFTLFATILVLFVFGVSHAQLMNSHLPLDSDSEVSEARKIVLLGVSGLLTILAGFLVSDSDHEPYRECWASFTRCYGAVLGLLYLERHIPAQSIAASLLVNPIMWYIGDGSVNGFLTAALSTILGALLTGAVTPALFTQVPAARAVLNFVGVGSSYFGASLLAGNLGRGLVKYFNLS